MKMLVATGLTREQVQKFMKDYYELDSASLTAVTVVPERKRAVENNHGIPFCIILSAVINTMADYLITHVFNEKEDGLMIHWGWGGVFKVMEENEVLAMQFIEPSQFERHPELPHFGWCGAKNT